MQIKVSCKGFCPCKGTCKFIFNLVYNKKKNTFPIADQIEAKKQQRINDRANAFNAKYQKAAENVEVPVESKKVNIQFSSECSFV